MGPEKPPVIVLAGIRWSFLWQRHQEISVRFARAGYPTTFVETTGLSNPRLSSATARRVAARLMRAGASRPVAEPGLCVYSPLVAPPTARHFRRLNEKLLVPRVVHNLRSVGGPEPIVVAYPPTRTTLDVISVLKPRLVYYDCSDDYEHFRGAPTDIRETERELLDVADLVSCTSTPLLEKVRPLRPDAFLSGPGVDYNLFASLQGDERKEIRTVCYFGTLSDERTDFSTLRAIANAGYEVRLVGGLDRVDRQLLRMSSVDYRGEVRHVDLPSALRGVDAFVLPYKVNGLTRSIFPAKTFECLATGKPVIAAPIPSMVELSQYVYPAEGPKEFVEVLEGLPESESEEKMRRRTELSQANSWEARFGEIEEALWRAME